MGRGCPATCTSQRSTPRGRCWSATTRIARTTSSAASSSTPAWAGADGYLTLFVDMAGTGASEGSYGESFDLPREGRDCAEIIEWAARQDWCDGTVGAWGVSYGGMTSLAAAACRPPHLRAIAAVYATTDMYADTIAPGDSPAMLGRYAWAAHMLALGLCPPTRQDPGGRWERIWRQRLQRLGTGQPHALAWQAHPDRDDYWQARVVDASAIDVPTMLIGGWTDAYADAILPCLRPGGRGQAADHWSLDARPAASVRIPALRLGRRDGGRWDTHLRPEQPRPEPDPPSAVLLQRRRLARRASVAARRSVQQAVLPDRASPRGECAATPGPAATTAQIRWWAVARGSRTRSAPATAGPRSRAGDDARSLTFTSDPLPEPLLVAGGPEADLYLDLPPDTELNLVARVCMISPDGRSTLITTGWRRVRPTAPMPLRRRG